MIGVNIKTQLNFGVLENRVKSNAAKNLNHMAAIIRKSTQESMKQGRRSNPSNPGQVPHKVSGRLSRSIRFGKTQDGHVIVGPAKRSGAFYGDLHEHGGVHTVKRGKRKGMKMRFPKRPFMQPAMKRENHRFPILFKGNLT